MAAIFINYRTDDDASAAALVDRELWRVFGRDRVFRDCRSLRTGRDFQPEIQRALERSTVLLALVGPRWWELRDERGRRRIEDPDDFVRMEIRYALGRPDMVLIPLLLNGATLPKAHQLPADIAGFAHRHWAEFRARHDEADLRTLVDELSAHLPRPGPGAGPDQAGGTDQAGGADQAGEYNGIHVQGGAVFHGPVAGRDQYLPGGGDRG
ncbi:toll/interleukin-1 receptor domain-containing protein [Micromonospora sp. PLK6-60]|uniref:toll/interleukin-1 receptor domain-containing protein n=1 Tax=Micromonospora sp. PLK6-60 TaxID=2873383 RepID=UPI001CA77187|nr:toll/interleukin-1 receptor domain-containing protein [Micromonospora sp. PLK6-60]MBY8873792.1 toll/interleukin-1 receptor domain-containing protein [Micromonospora sp. PLK6-60]